MVEKAEQQASSFNLPKGAPYVPTKVPKLPAATGTTRLESEQKPRQVGVATPLEKAAALTRAKEDSFPALPAERGGGTPRQQPDPQPTGLPGTGLPGATLPKPTGAPEGELPSAEPLPAGAPGQPSAAEPEPKTDTATAYPDGSVKMHNAAGDWVGWEAPNGDQYYFDSQGNFKVVPADPDKYWTWKNLKDQDLRPDDTPDADGKYAVYDGKGNLTGYLSKDEHGQWSYLPPGNYAEQGQGQGQPLETGPGWHDADGNWFDPTDTTAPGYDPEIDPSPNNKEFNIDKYNWEKEKHAAKSASDKAFDDQMDNITESNLVAAAQAKRRLMAQYGQAGMAGSGQFMTEMGKIDIDYQRATNEAHGDLMIEQRRQDAERDIELLLQRLEFATGEEAEQLQERLTQLMLDRDKEEQFLEIFFGSPKYLKEIWGADAVDPDSWPEFMEDMEAAEATGDPKAVVAIYKNVKYHDGSLYYESEWKTGFENNHGKNGDQSNHSFWTHIFGPMGDLYKADENAVRLWMVSHGYDPGNAEKIMETYFWWTTYQGDAPVLVPSDDPDA